MRVKNLQQKEVSSPVLGRVDSPSITLCAFHCGDLTVGVGTSRTVRHCHPTQASFLGENVTPTKSHAAYC